MVGRFKCVAIASYYPKRKLAPRVLEEPWGLKTLGDRNYFNGLCNRTRCIVGTKVQSSKVAIEPKAAAIKE